MKRYAIAIMIALAALSAGCATTKHSQGAWTSWPTSEQTQAELATVIDQIAKGDFENAEKTLTPALRASSPTAAYLHAEIAAFRALNSTAIARFTDFLTTYPEDPLATAAIIRLKMISGYSVEPLDFDKLKNIRTTDPYAAAHLTVLQNSAMRNAPNQETLSHPTALPLVKWSWIGPFTGYLMTGFDTPQPFDNDPKLADSYTVGPRTLVPFKYVPENRTPMAANVTGIYAAETRIASDIDQEIMLTVHGAHFYTVFVDNAPVLTRDVSDFGQNSTLASKFTLPAGEHLLRLRIALSPSANVTSLIRLWLTPQNGLDTLRELDDTSGVLPDSSVVRSISRFDNGHVLGDASSATSDMLQTWIAAPIAISDGNAQLADHILSEALKKHPNDVISKFWLAMRYTADKDLAPALRSEKSIAELKALFQDAPQFALAHENLILEYMKQKQPRAALETFADLKPNMPETADQAEILSSLAKSLSWTEFAEKFTHDAATRSPNACSLAAKEVDYQRLHNTHIAFDSLPSTIQSCPNVIRAYAKSEGNAVQNHDWLDEIQKLSDKYPNNASLRMEAINIRASKDPQGAIRQFDDLLDGVARGYYPPFAAENALEFIDSLRAQGLQSDADNILKKLAETFPNDEIYQNMLWQHTQTRPFEDLRIDGMKIIQEYAAKDHDDAGSSVMLLDYAATRIMPNGTKLGLTHQISRVLSKEGKNEIGEIYLPDAASVLKIRTIKDNTFEVFEPETILYKQSTTAPNLAVGDYVEVEYLTFDGPVSNVTPRAVTDAFYYGTNSSPMLRSEYIFEYPKDANVTIVENGPKDQIKKSCAPQGDYIRCTTVRENIPVFIPEPQNSSPNELIPNIQVYYNYDWNTVISSLAETISRQTRMTPYIQKYYEKLGVPESNSTWEHARAIYDSVIDSIHESESVRNTDEDSATNTVTRGIGSRMVTLKALYDLAGFESYFALVRSVAAMKGSETLPAQYDNSYATMLIVETEKGPAYVQPSEDYVPFDYLGNDFQNQTVIPLNGREQYLSRTNDKEAMRALINISYDISADGTAKAKSEEIIQGTRALVMRNFLTMFKHDPDKAELVVENNLANSYGRVALTRLENQNLDDKNQPLILQYDFDIPNFADESDNSLNIISKIFAYNLVAQLAQLAPEQRKYPLIVTNDILSARTLTFHAPENFTWDLSTIRDVSIDTQFGKYSRQSHLDGKDLKIAEKIELLPQRVETEDYAAFRNFCLSVDEAQKIIISAHH